MYVDAGMLLDDEDCALVRFTARFCKLCNDIGHVVMVA